jgi:hypothetical protein
VTLKSHIIINEFKKALKINQRRSFSSNKGAAPVFTKKENATLAQHIEILD